MITYVDFTRVTEEHLKRIVRSLAAAPEEVRPDAIDYLRELQSGDIQLYEFDGGLLLVSKLDKRLVLRGLCGDNCLRKARDITADLKKLAAEWLCDTIETIVFDPRLASAICKLGGRVESQTVVLAVE